MLGPQAPHEIIVRLKGAEENLLRLEDVLKQIDSQADSLKRQARQASRYKGLASEIRKNEALVHYISYHQVTTEKAEAEEKLKADTVAVE